MTIDATRIIRVLNVTTLSIGVAGLAVGFFSGWDKVIGVGVLSLILTIPIYIVRVIIEDGFRSFTGQSLYAATWFLYGIFAICAFALLNFLIAFGFSGGVTALIVVPALVGLYFIKKLVDRLLAKLNDMARPKTNARQPQNGAQTPKAPLKQ